MRVLNDWFLTPDRAAIHLPTATAVIADPHWEYDQARNSAGEAVPTASFEEMIAPLARLLTSHPISRLVIAGDLVEGQLNNSIINQLLDWLRAARVELAAAVPGNHDRGMKNLTAMVPFYVDGYSLGEWLVIHGDGPLPRGTAVIQGHVHPCLRHGCNSAPCYLVSRRHIILPAFSGDAAGVNVLRQRRWQHFRCYAIAGNNLLDFGRVGPLQQHGEVKNEKMKR